MKYEAFTIENFKGIKSTSVKFRGVDTANVITLIGLNESGKTTLLEGIYGFSPDPESRNLYADKKVLGPNLTARIPRNRLFNFSDEIVITATVATDEEEWAEISAEILDAMGLNLDTSNSKMKFTIRDVFSYENSTFKDRLVYWDTPLKVKGKKAKNFRSVTDEENLRFYTILERHLPSIAYFPTFLSEVPSKVYLDGHSDDLKNKFYRNVFQDILNTLGAEITIKSQILDRLEPPSNFVGSIAESIATFFGSDRKSMVQQVIDKASQQLSNVIVFRWNQMFEKKPLGKEIIIEWGVDEDAKNGRRDPYISFAVRDGADRYNIADRSLGFRWFFCFLLFTQFRAKRSSGAGTLFLFDEPASNLHAKAQEKLLDSFDDVCSSPNALIYSTHSPYMINPMWLDQAYIVENESISSDIDDIATMAMGSEAEIVATPYHEFIERFPQRISHFQPVLDRLEVKPDLMSVKERSVLVEGKSDFVILSKLLEHAQTDFRLVPAHGATTMGPLIALAKGWNWPFFVLLDGDKAGKTAKEFYEKEYSLVDSEIRTLADLDGSAKGVESLIVDSDLEKIKSHFALTRKPKKGEIYDYFVGLKQSELPIESCKSPAVKALAKAMKSVFSAK